MLTKRIIPCLDVTDGKVVKGINFVNLKNVGDPVDLGKRYSDMGADELVYLDISATKENRNILIDLVEKVAKNVFIPFTIGGGIRNIDDIKSILKAGADKVAINSAAVLNPNLVEEASQLFGKQCITVAVDVKKNGNGWQVYISGGSKPTTLDAITWITKLEKLGAGEILLTSIDRDGTNKGFDIDLYKNVTSSINIPVIASGGGGKKEDFLELFEKTDVDAALAASIFHYNRISLKELKSYLLSNDIPIREAVE